MKKSQIVRLRLTEEERLAWTAKADNAGISLSALIRHGVEATRLPTRRQPPKADPALLTQLARIGSNLNQLAKWTNINKSGIPAAAVIARLIEIDREIGLIRKGAAHVD